MYIVSYPAIFWVVSWGVWGAVSPPKCGPGGEPRKVLAILHSE